MKRIAVALAFFGLLIAAAAGTAAIKEKDFDKAALWPPSTHHWMNPDGVEALDYIPQPLDLGALKVEGGVWKILIIGGGDPGYWWEDFNPADPSHWQSANFFNRYGRGHSRGPASNLHNEVLSWYVDVYGRPPTEMEWWDIEHDKSLWSALLAAFNAKNGIVIPPKPTTTAPASPPVPPVVPTEPTAPPVVAPACPTCPICPACAVVPPSPPAPSAEVLATAANAPGWRVARPKKLAQWAQWMADFETWRARYYPPPPPSSSRLQMQLHEPGDRLTLR